MKLMLCDIDWSESRICSTKIPAMDYTEPQLSSRLLTIMAGRTVLPSDVRRMTNDECEADAVTKSELHGHAVAELITKITS